MVGEAVLDKRVVGSQFFDAECAIKRQRWRDDADLEATREMFSNRIRAS